MAAPAPVLSPGQWQAVFDALPANVAVLDATGCIVATNAAWCRSARVDGLAMRMGAAGSDYLAGYERAAESGVHGAAEGLAGLRSVLSGERKRFEQVYPCHAPGAERWFRMEVLPLRGDPGEGVMVRQVDVSPERKLAARLRAAQRAEVVAQVAASLAHDFNNVLTVVEGNAELLRKRLSDPDDNMLAGRVVDAARRGAGLAQHLLAFARREAPDPQPFPPARLVRELERMARRVLGDDITLVVMANDTSGEVLGVQVQLENALLGLCLNAREAMPGGGQLVLAVDRLQATPRDLDPDRQAPAGDYVRIEVVDTGGPAARELACLLVSEGGNRAAVDGSSGLGMAYGAVRAEGGYMDVRAEPGHGTYISLYLPRLSPTPGPPAADAAEVQSGRERILLVEDDPLVREYAYGQLTALGYSVVVTGSGEEALAVLSGPEGFDLLFTDVVMPGGMNGAQLFESARLRCPDLKVLFCSGYPASVLAADGRLPTGGVLLAKPYRKHALAERLRQVFAANTGSE